VVTVLAVAVAMFFVANWFARPVKLITEALGEIARGRYDFRIREQRKDEFGLLYASFDQMAQALQERHAAPSVASTPTRPAAEEEGLTAREQSAIADAGVRPAGAAADLQP